MIKGMFIIIRFFVALALLGAQSAHAQMIPPSLYPSLKMDAGLAAQAPLSADVQAAMGAAAQSAAQGSVAPRDQYVVVAPAAPGSVFGSQLFGGTFRGTLNQGFNTDYVVAIGDRLLVRLWGGINHESSLVVDGQESWLRSFGQIFLTDKWTPAGRLIHGAADSLLYQA